MRRISGREFYQEITSYPDKELVAKIDEAHQDRAPVTTVGELRRYMLTVTAPALADAAAINGCQCRETLMAYAREAVNIIGSLTKDDNPINSLEELQKTIWKKTIALSVSYSRRHLCHPLKNGFVCYCDEHSH